jgi:hypothetical protein
MAIWELRMLARLFRGLGVLVVLAAAPLLADDFLVESKVYLGKDEKKPVQSLTIFRSGSVYDFLTSPDEITVFDPPRKRFVVLDITRRVKVELNTDEVEAFSQRIKHEAQLRNIPLLSFLAEPSFDESFDGSSGELKLTSNWMMYRVKSVRPKLPTVDAQYLEYSDWQVKLNTLLRPGSLPPFPRLVLNEALEKHSRVPTEVELTRYGQHPVKRHVTIRAEHRWQWRLLESDLKRLEEANTHLVTFASVSLPEYLRPATSPTGSAEATSAIDPGNAALPPAAVGDAP